MAQPSSSMQRRLVQVCIYREVSALNLRELYRESVKCRVLTTAYVCVVLCRVAMKHKFKPSVGSSRARKAAAAAAAPSGGTRAERQPSTPAVFSDIQDHVPGVCTVCNAGFDTMVVVCAAAVWLVCVVKEWRKCMQVTAV